MKNQTAKSLLTMFALVLGTLCAQSAPAQTFKRVKVKGGGRAGSSRSGRRERLGASQQWEPLHP